MQYTNVTLQNSASDSTNFYQTIDLLTIDGTQEWMTVTEIQNTFSHIFSHLFRNEKHIILASDRSPIDLKGMNERLPTWLVCGLIAELGKPSLQLCTDILNSKIQRGSPQTPDDVIQYIAQTANGGVRDS